MAGLPFLSDAAAQDGEQQPQSELQGHVPLGPHPGSATTTLRACDSHSVSLPSQYLGSHICPSITVQ